MKSTGNKKQRETDFKLIKNRGLHLHRGYLIFNTLKSYISIFLVIVIVTSKTKISPCMSELGERVILRSKEFLCDFR